MAGKTNRHKLVLTEDEYRELETISGSRTKPTREVQRANILLSYANGKSISQIRKELDVSRPTIYKCIDKALAGGILLGMRDFFHQPKQAEITDEAKVWVVNLACTKPKDRGLAAEFWTLGELAKYARQNAPKEGHGCLGRAAKATIWRILDEHPVKPHKKRYYLEKRDERFDEKMRLLLIVCKEVKTTNESLKPGELPEMVTLSGDEMTGIQAIRNVSDEVLFHFEWVKRCLLLSQIGGNIPENVKGRLYFFP